MIVDFGLGAYSSVTAHRLPLIAHCLLDFGGWTLDFGLMRQWLLISGQEFLDLFKGKTVNPNRFYP